MAKHTIRARDLGREIHRPGGRRSIPASKLPTRPAAVGPAVAAETDAAAPPPPPPVPKAGPKAKSKG